MDISVVMLSFNTRDTTRRCLLELDALCALTPHVQVEVIVVDNASSDGSAAMLSDLALSHCTYTLIPQDHNMGFSAGNNVGINRAKGRYVLLLNSDVMVSTTPRSIDLAKICAYMDAHAKVGALTVRVELPGGTLDRASHRGFPTVWRSLTYFAGLERAVETLRLNHTALGRLMGGYHLVDADLGKEHEIDAGTAAFLLCRTEVIRELGGFDEQFFMYGEDLDLCYRIKEKGYQVVWYPVATVTHLKYQSGLMATDPTTRRRIRWYYYDAMERFFLKHYAADTCPCLRYLIRGVLWIRKKNVI